MTTYEIGERVWVRAEGHPWWPAIVVIGAMHNVQVQDGEVAVCYYGTGEFDVCDAGDADRIVPFETSSEKAATSDADLRAAITAAEADDSALALRTSVLVNRAQKRDRSPDGGAAHRKPQARSDATAAGSRRKQQGHGLRGRADPTESMKGLVSATTILEEGRRLGDAVAAKDVAGARRALLRLANVRLTYELLAETRIGVRVADVLASEAFAPVYPLAKAVLGDWVCKLPEATLQVIRHETLLAGE